MNSMKNKVQLIGNLGADPEVKEFGSGKMLAKLKMATSDTYRDKDGNKIEETYWHNLIVWGKLAKIAQQYLYKGKQIAVEGKLTNRSYDDKDGNKRYFTEIVVSDFVMLGGRQQ